MRPGETTRWSLTCCVLRSFLVMIFLKFLEELTSDFREKRRQITRERDFIRLRGARCVIQKNSTPVIEYAKCGSVNDYYG
jgi:hypothetical protein